MYLTHKKTTIAGIIGLLFSSHIVAADTSTSAQTKEVVVTATRTLQPKDSIIADVTVIDREEIERAGQSSFIELLQRQPGVEISSNGGAGTNASVFLRGTNANQVVVLIDGMRVGSATTGQTAFQNIPLGQIERIEILRGPASSLYGQDAIGGVIQIFTKKGNSAPQFNAALGYGTYNTKTAAAGVSGKVNDTRFSLNLSGSNTDGFSAINFPTGAQADKDGYSNFAVNGSISHEIIQGHELGLQVFSSEGRGQFDSTDINNKFSNYSELSQKSYSLFSKNQLTSFWLSNLRLGDGVDDLLSHSSTGTSKFETKQRQYSWQNDFTLPVGTLTLLYDRLEQEVTSTTNYNKNARNNNGYTASYLANVGDHSFQASYRTDHNSQFGTNNTGGIGYGFSFNPNWRATASYGTAFRAPTFNELYFPGFGSPTLKPEKSKNTEASLRYENNASSASVTAYENNVTDLIVAASNVNKAKIQGVTFAANQQIAAWHFGGSVDIKSPKDDATDTILARRAQRHASGNLSYNWQDWRFGSELIASSVRYNDPANQFKLAGYALLNLTADYKINQDWKIQGRLNNLLDKNYSLATSASSFGPNDPAYNTPGVNLFVSVRWEPSSK